MSAGGRRTKRKWLIVLLGGLLFVSQIAAAAQACMIAMAGSQQSPVQAMSQEGCDSTPMDAAVCRVRCLSQDQTAASPDQPLQAVAVSASLQQDAVAPIAVQCASQFSSAARLPGGPPLRILHCSYQI
jgi:hypothetical protein